MDTLNKRNGLN